MTTLPDASCLPPGWERALCPADLIRAQRFRRRSDGVRFLHSRWWLRTLLASHLGVAPGALQFATNQYGKPHLTWPAGAGLHFNLSHSGALAAIAVSRSCPVGIDVEQVTSEPPIAEGGLSRSELTALRSASSPTERAVLFYRIWTWREAVMKAEGTGLGGTPPEWPPGTLWDSQFTRVVTGANPELTVANLDLQDGWTGAIAALSSRVRLPTTPQQFVFPIPAVDQVTSR